MRIIMMLSLMVTLALFEIKNLPIMDGKLTKFNPFFEKERLGI